MGWFSKASAPPPPPPRDVAALTAPFAVPAVRIALSPKIRNSHFLGEPQLSDGAAWPEKDGRKLGFVAQIDLAEVAAAASLPWLPASGSLAFFYDFDEQPWGFDPNDRGAWSVVYQPAQLQPQTKPFPNRNMEFFALASLPGYERPQIGSLALTDEECDWLDELRKSGFGEESRFQMGGFPVAIQNDDMEYDCELVTNGFNTGDGKIYGTSQAERLKPNAESWKLLLQIPTDEKLDLMWGDSGTIYFWIREQDARALRFDQAWLALQCY